MSYAKLKDLDSITIQDAKGVQYKKWNSGENKMEFSSVQENGFRAEYQFTVDSADIISLSEAQLGAMLVAAYGDGKADVMGKTFRLSHKTVNKRFPDGEREITYTDFTLSDKVESTDDEEENELPL